MATPWHFGTKPVIWCSRASFLSWLAQKLNILRFIWEKVTEYHCQWEAAQPFPLIQVGQEADEGSHYQSSKDGPSWVSATYMHIVLPVLWQRCKPLPQKPSQQRKWKDDKFDNWKESWKLEEKCNMIFNTCIFIINFCLTFVLGKG